jgi:predicted dehydrogenase
LLECGWFATFTLSALINKKSMENGKRISRKKFLYQAGVLGVGSAVVPFALEGASFEQAGKKVKVGIIGCGSVSTQYLPHLSKSPYAELVCTCDIIPQRAVDAAKKYNIGHHYDSIEAMLDGAPFDLMVNLTDMQEHGRLNKLALMADKNVWSEKPMATTYAEGRELLDLAKKNGVRLWGAPAVVNSPQFAFMARAIADGKIGKVAAAHAHYGHLGPDWSAFFYEKNGGSMPDLAVYNIASLTGLLGPVKSVMAMLNIVTPTRKVANRPAPIRVEEEDNAMILMEHDSGALSHVQSGFNYYDPYGHGGKGQDRHTIMVWGTKGNINLVGYDWAPAGVDMANEEQEEKSIRYVPDAGTYVWQEGASNIVECMVTGREPLINAEHSLHVLEIIEAARSSQKKVKRIELQSKFPWPVIK